MEGEVAKNFYSVPCLGLIDGLEIFCTHPRNPLLFYSATSGPLFAPHVQLRSFDSK